MSKLITAKELAEMLHVKTRSIYQMVYRSQLPHIKFGGTLRFDPEEIQAFINKGHREALNRG